MRPTYDKLPALIACHKNVFGLENPFVRQSLRASVEYNRALGVEHFVFYVREVNREVEEARLLFEELVLDRNDITLFTIPPSLLERNPSYWGHIFYPEHFVLNDCLWRARLAGVGWIMVQMDPDERIVGTDDLKALLTSQPHDVLHAGHITLSLNHTTLPPSRPFPRGYTLNVTHKLIDWGKSIVRANSTNILHVHVPTSPKSDFPLQGILGLLHFSHSREKHDQFKESDFKILNASDLPQW